MPGSGGKAAGRGAGFLVAAGRDTHTPAMTEQAVQDALSLTLNGEPRRFARPLTVAGLLGALGLDPRKVAVERNEAIVPRSTYDQTVLSTGDAIEIVHFIGGG